MRFDTVVEKVCAMLDHLAVRQGVRMRMFIDPRIPFTLLGDEMRLRQVLVNLAGNAIKFSSGRLRQGQVAVRALLAGRDEREATVDLIVSDNGIGMNRAAQAQLFAPFSQADASTTRRFGGTGLGLAISGTLARLMGGGISVTSEPDLGLTFTVRLRFGVPGHADAAADAAIAEDAVARRLIAGLHCRIVGEEQGLADDLTAMLLHAGMMRRAVAEPGCGSGRRSGAGPQSRSRSMALAAAAGRAGADAARTASEDGRRPPQSSRDRGARTGRSAPAAGRCPGSGDHRVWAR